MTAALDTHLSDLLGRFAARRDLGALGADAEGRYRLELDGWLEVRIFQSGGDLFLEGSPGRLPAEDPREPDRIADLLREQVRDLEDQEEVLSLDPEGEDLILFRRLQASGLRLDDFERALESFANRLERWTRRLAADRTVPSPVAAPMHIIFP
ncbi:CesT family type III secretion system chaperone [Imhoffiella purpurea]|uniref:Uncharacterized protein n=1 Tax=Imhoffiella purpurea TaxID=1249627 RepID=W9VF83_9GAMM|nr:CesT family type III secretion system chaperone [Imhoffiella purpurea]EXJ15661.1 hypothetical protein D779_1168 [Imhoffiella purpurea]